MPRINREVKNGNEAQSAPKVDAVHPKDVRSMRWGRDPFEGVKVEDVIPFTSREELPEADVKFTEFTNTKGELLNKRDVACGAGRVYMEQSAKGWIHLIGIYKNGKGVATRNLRTLKPFKNTDGMPPGVLRSSLLEDKRVFKLLQDKGVKVFPAISVGTRG